MRRAAVEVLHPPPAAPRRLQSLRPAAVVCRQEVWHAMQSTRECQACMHACADAFARERSRAGVVGGLTSELVLNDKLEATFDEYRRG